ncbi:putative telomere-binding alpha subunit central domain-containing protein [Botrytis fragariae]|uniref:Protection of telomeres protein 1 n=1 Tax=Botrytis fragariae TaxID=1964551 RepID=A0A8H6B132_9HELO|nr:putative telomere-binding alpha subunit central domain-containing protein [Botrytis fragariae]KAF5877234.1 putative telomere-binding alpha subunit central domain-containing protein [Botrytis fragariae]
MDNMQNVDTMEEIAKPEVVTPKGFQTVEQIKSFEILPGGVVKPQFVNVIGFVMDHQPPIQTKGTDFKCSFQIKDFSSRFERFGLRMSVFATEDKMPQIHKPKDAVLIRSAKVQLRNGEIQLLSHFSTEYHILRAEHIPKAIFPVIKASWISTPPARCRRPEPIETKYVVWSNQNLDEVEFPGTQEFQEKAKKALQVRDKFSLLKDVKDGSFHDIIGEVRKIYGANNDMVTVYFTDYTAHSNFYNYTLPGLSSVVTEGRDGDEYGYIKAKPKDEAKEWKGPFGKMTIQLTLFDAHAMFIREENIKEGQWLRLTNVQFKSGNAGLMEGKLRGDRGASDGKVQVEIMKTSEDPQNNDPRWKDCLRRKRDWTQKHEKERKRLQEEISGAGTKRKAEGQISGKNSKARRKESRARTEAKSASSGMKAVENLDLNENVILHPSLTARDIIPLSSILQRTSPISSDPKFAGINAPFENNIYKTNLRVVDYLPHSIADFAVGRKISEFDVLSDYSGDEDDDPKEDMQSFREGKGCVERKWEWFFSLVVEDANPDASKERAILRVENYDAQMLLNLQGDACNLRINPGMLRDVKETLFKLWGDLEEQKSALLLQKVGEKSDTEKVAPEASRATDSESEDEGNDLSKSNHSLPVDSEDEAGDSTRQKQTKGSEKPVVFEQTNADIEVMKKVEQVEIPQDIKPKNKPFQCYIKEYGIKVKEEDPLKANAGNGKRWLRVFGLCYTIIR